MTQSDKIDLHDLPVFTPASSKKSQQQSNSQVNNSSAEKTPRSTFEGNSQFLEQQILENPPSFIPVSRDQHFPNQPRSQSSRTQQSQSAENAFASNASRNAPPTFQPGQSGSGYRSTSSGTSHINSARPSTYAYQSSRSVNNSGNANFTPNNSDATHNAHAHNSASLAIPTVKPRRLFRKIIGIIGVVLAIILAVLGYMGYSTYRWIDNDLQRFPALTSQANDPMSTNWLIVGSDARDGTAGGAKDSIPGERTDTIMMLFSPSNGSKALLSIPRDTYVVVNDTGMKINAVAETYGFSRLTSTLETLSDTKINHVVKIGFAGVKDIVDALGGVYLCYDHNVNDDLSNMHWQAGCHTVQGDQALAYSRMRYADPEGDLGRAKRQRALIQAIAKKMTSAEVLLNPTKLHNVINAGLHTIKVDNDTTPMSLLNMAMAFKEATGSQGITGTPYISDINYYPSDAVGSSILLDDTKNSTLFKKIIEGTQPPGRVGGLE